MMGTVLMTALVAVFLLAADCDPYTPPPAPPIPINGL